MYDALPVHRPRKFLKAPRRPTDAQLVVLAEHVALSLDERGFGRGAAQLAQLMGPCDAQLVLLVEHVALALDERGFS